MMLVSGSGIGQNREAYCLISGDLNRPCRDIAGMAEGPHKPSPWAELKRNRLMEIAREVEPFIRKEILEVYRQRFGDMDEQECSNHLSVLRQQERIQRRFGRDIVIENPKPMDVCPWGRSFRWRSV